MAVQDPRWTTWTTWTGTYGLLPNPATRDLQDPNVATQKYRPKAAPRKPEAKVPAMTTAELTERK